MASTSMKDSEEKVSSSSSEGHITSSLQHVPSTDTRMTMGEVEGLQYTVEENPPFYMCVMLGFQHYISMFIATLTVPFLLAPKLCMEEDNVGKSELISTLFTASGIITLLQTFLGIRLPIVQAGTFALLAPTLAYFSLPVWECPNNIVPAGTFANGGNSSNMSFIEVGSEAHREIWQTRLREIQGSLMVAALFEIILGLTGAVGMLLRFIGPLSICPTVSLLGLSLFKSAAAYGAKQWWICLLTISLMIMFSQYLGGINFPCVAYTKQKGVHKKGYPILKMFPVILAIAIAWLLCFFLTLTNVFPDDKQAWGYGARTDLRTDVLYDSAWFRLPYPGQWGMPSISISCVAGLLAGLIATTVESVGDYHACARLSGAPAPPTHAINRGIFIEGLGSFLDALFGTGNGTTSTSINVGVVGITKVGSRRVVQFSAMFMIALGVFNKFGALFVTVPDPVIGGSFFILFGMIVAVGISNLQYVDLNSSRNLFIIGFSFLMGLSLPQWMLANKEAIKTGSAVVDSVLQVLLSTSMFVGGALGFILDCTIPGTEEERGMAHWRKLREAQSDSVCHESLQQRVHSVYDLPFGMKFLRKWHWARYIPISPTFGSKKNSRTPLDQEYMMDGRQEGVHESLNVDATDL